MTLYQVTDITEALQLLEQLLDNAHHTHSVHVPGTSDVSPKLRLPTEQLTSYLQDQHGLGRKGEEPVVKQFTHGQSNPTYYLSYGGQEMVLRKKPVSRGDRMGGKLPPLKKCARLNLALAQQVNQPLVTKRRLLGIQNLKHCLAKHPQSPYGQSCIPTAVKPVLHPY